MSTSIGPAPDPLAVDIDVLVTPYSAALAHAIELELADLFVDKSRRGQGIGTSAIALAEQKAKEEPGVEAMVLQVVTRNEDALRLYHHWGYDTMSMVTLRKEFYENRRDRKADFLGMTFHI